MIESKYGVRSPFRANAKPRYHKREARAQLATQVTHHDATEYMYSEHSILYR